MPRFRHINSGVTVSVSDEFAKTIDSEWEPVSTKAASKPAAKKAAPARAAESKTDEK